MEQIRKFFKDESGATAVEYALIVALLAAIIVAAVGVFGTSLQGAFEGISGRLDSEIEKVGS